MLKVFIEVLGLTLTPHSLQIYNTVGMVFSRKYFYICYDYEI